MGPAWVLSAPDGPHVDPINLGIRVCYWQNLYPTLSGLECAAEQVFNKWKQRGIVAYKSWWSLEWRHNEHDGISNHQPHHCLLKHLLGHRSKKTSKLPVTGLCAGNSPVTSEFPIHMASNVENVSIWWRHRGLGCFKSPHMHQARGRQIIQTHLLAITQLKILSWVTPHKYTPISAYASLRLPYHPFPHTRSWDIW